MFAYSIILTFLCLSTCSAAALKCSNKFDIDYGTVDNFTDHMCLYCFDTMRNPYPKDYPVWADKTPDSWYINVSSIGNVVMDPQDGTILYTLVYEKLKAAAASNGTHSDLLLKQFSSKFYRNAFMKCCADAHRCCQQSSLVDDIQGHCPMHWDGWSCWDSTSPGTIEGVCPDMSVYLLKYFPDKCLRETVTRECDHNGKWDKVWNPVFWRWTDPPKYGQCGYTGRSVRLATSTTLIILEGVSLVCTAVGLVLFIFYKLYSQFRLQIHVNFFASVMLTSLIAIHFEILVNRAHLENSKTNLLNNPFLCKTFSFLEKDFRLMNFFWMLIEGFNFHHMVVFTFTDLSKYKLPIYLIGWGLSHVIMLVYALVRANVSNDLCWTSSIGKWELIYIIPAYLCFFINLVLFINLLRVIVIKLMLPKNNHYSRFAKRGVKTSLVLLPIFGLQYFIQGLPIDASETCNSFLIGLLYLQTVIEGAQGIIVTTALCFLNKEVYSCVRKSISSMDSNSILTSSNTLSDDSRHSS